MPCKYCAAGNTPRPDGTTLMHLVLEDLPYIKLYQQCEDEAAARKALAAQAEGRPPEAERPH